MAATAVKKFKTVTQTITVPKTIETQVPDGVVLHLDDKQAQILAEILATIGNGVSFGLTGDDGVYGALVSAGYAFTTGYSRKHFQFQPQRDTGTCGGSLYIT